TAAQNARGGTAKGYKSAGITGNHRVMNASKQHQASLLGSANGVASNAAEPRAEVYLQPSTCGRTEEAKFSACEIHLIRRNCSVNFRCKLSVNRPVYDRITKGQTLIHIPRKTITRRILARNVGNGCSSCISSTDPKNGVSTFDSWNDDCHIPDRDV